MMLPPLLRGVQEVADHGHHEADDDHEGGSAPEGHHRDGNCRPVDDRDGIVAEGFDSLCLLLRSRLAPGGRSSAGTYRRSRDVRRKTHRESRQASRSSGCPDGRTVPERERITSDWVRAPPERYRTPCSRSPSVTPEAAKKTLSPLTRSSVLQHLLEVVARVDRGLSLLVVARPEPPLELAAEALERGGREHRLGRAADAPQQVDAGVGSSRPSASRRRRRGR